jgi:hypothetical protein
MFTAGQVEHERADGVHEGHLIHANLRCQLDCAP